MTAERCKAIAPIWASSMPQEPPKPMRSTFRSDLAKWFGRFWKRNAIAIIVVVAWAASLIGSCVVTGTIVKRNTTVKVTEEVEARKNAAFQAYLNELEQQQKAESFLTGDASFEAAVDELAKPLAHVLATYRMEFGLNENGLRTVGWVWLARYAANSSEFGKTPQEITAKSNAWEGKPAEHAVANQDVELASELVRNYMNGIYPDGFTLKMTFGDREAGGGFVARNEYYTGPNTVYWRYK